MEQLGKLLIIVGAVVFVVGCLVWILGKAGWRGLPGDIEYESNGFRFYFPLVTCIVISIVLTAIVWLCNWLRRG